MSIESTIDEINSVSKNIKQTNAIILDKKNKLTYLKISIDELNHDLAYYTLLDDNLYTIKKDFCVISKTNAMNTMPILNPYMPKSQIILNKHFDFNIKHTIKPSDLINLLHKILIDTNEEFNSITFQILEYTEVVDKLINYYIENNTIILNHLIFNLKN